MNSQKEDPRVLRTQEMLKNALIQMLDDGVPLHQITVQKLTKYAKLNRTTFYLHYQDVEDLREQLTEDILTTLEEKVEDLREVLVKNRRDQLTHLLQYLQDEHKKLYVLHQFEKLEQHLFELMKDFILVSRTRSKSNSKRALIDPDIKTASLVGIIMWWLKSGQHISSADISDQIHLMYRT